MKSITVTIVDPIGIHARPASRIVTATSKFQSSVAFKIGEKTANAKSLVNLMALGATQGSKVTIEVIGADEDAALAAIDDILTSEKLV